jgi:hypothetical protein
MRLSISHLLKNAKIVSKYAKIKDNGGYGR